MSQKCIVIVDDEPQVLASMSRCLRKVDANIHTFESPLKAIEEAIKLKPSIVVSDQRMPFMSGIEMIAQMRDKGLSFDAVLVSAFNDFNDVAEAFNKGVIQKYLAKPWDNEELRKIVNSSLAKEPQEKQSNQRNVVGFHGIISEDPSMEKTFNYIKKASQANIPVFITGETGTGKELAAKAFHKEGLQSDCPFVAVNCANFSETLMESQLFGHVKGAFTGAVNNQAGLLETSSNGVLFLDEITCLPLSLQAKLLRVLQEREFSPIGSNSVKKFLAQVVSASSLPLQTAVERGEFREDLFYRLNVISVGLPPLRERGNDVLLLAEYFLNNFNKELSKSIQGFSASAKQKLLNYHWPGNVRQLQNLLHSIVVLNEGPLIEADQIDIDLKYEVKSSEVKEVNSKNENLSKPLSDSIQPLWLSEKQSIEQAIQAFDGNIPKAAAVLEVSPSTLYRKIQSWKKLQND